ncbi:OmpA family protein [Candidatus Thioglobus sp.]|jgi:Outer membrane protein and related peptidoglycan-associated (lipo)proteins|uniref:OmpA family protein n=1 Tax=Candidatus Thioglobus sp. TaxID=2026721 RepID=UPI001774C6AC|nr:flagellar motor protein MotB [Candidatus Thioglobus sp.]
MIRTIFLITTVSLLSACSITDDYSGPAVVEDRSNVTQESIIASDESNFESKSIVGTSASLSSTEKAAVVELKSAGASFILHFSYDGFDIDESATAQIIKHANFMRDNPSVDLRLEGHADERGTREYNLALGENRALSVKEVLGLYDLSSRVEVISFGEESPVSELHDEDGWQQNRRVEFIYR